LQNALSGDVQLFRILHFGQAWIREPRRRTRFLYNGVFMRGGNGFLIAMAGFALLSCGDAVIKSMAGQWPVPAIAALRFTLAVPLLAMIVAVKDGSAGFAVRRPWVQLGRGLMLVAASMLFFFSIFLMPLAEATSIVFVSPVITALLSSVFLKEPMHPRAWPAIGLALCGVALVLRPNLAEMGAVALLPLASAFFFSCMIIFNRMAAGTGGAVALQLAMVLVAAPIVGVIAFVGDVSGIPTLAVDWPEPSVVLRCAIVAVSASTAHWLVFQGTMRTSAADAAQAVYVQLPAALVIDAMIFRNFPDVMALGGAFLIVCAGLSMWMSQRDLAERGLNNPPS
jgi:drug/metabolite transporter (DMT)-like permease